MSRARDIANLVDANGDIVVGALDNVPPSNDASALTTGTLDGARLPDPLPAIDGSALTGIASDLVDDTTPQLGGALDLNSNNITGTGNIDVTGYAQFNTANTPLYVNSTNSSSYKINFRDNGTTVAYYGANSTYPMLVSNSSGANVVYSDSSGHLTATTYTGRSYSTNAVGAYVQGWVNNTTTNPGGTVSGSVLMYSNTGAGYRPSYLGVGTWRCHGAVQSGSGADEVSVWQRIS